MKKGNGGRERGKGKRSTSLKNLCEKGLIRFSVIKSIHAFDKI